MRIDDIPASLYCMGERPDFSDRMEPIAFLYLFVGTGILLCLVSLPLLAEKVPPNPVFGFRIPATLENRDIWYAANRYMARRLIFGSVAMVASVLTLYFAGGLSAQAYGLACTGVTFAILGVVVAMSVRYANKLRRLQTRQSRPRAS